MPLQYTHHRKRRSKIIQNIQTCLLNVIKLNPVLFTLTSGLDCDNDPVDIVLTLAATDDTSHLQKLQSMAEFISDEENIEFIKNAKSAEEVAKAINEFEPEE